MRGKGEELLVGRHSRAPDARDLRDATAERLLVRLHSNKEVSKEEVKSAMESASSGLREELGQSWVRRKLKSDIPKVIELSCLERTEDERRFLVDNYWQHLMDHSLTKEQAIEVISNGVVGPESIAVMEKVVDRACQEKKGWGEFGQIIKEDSSKQLQGPLEWVARWLIVYEREGYWPEVVSRHDHRGFAENWWDSLYSLSPGNAREQVLRREMSEWLGEMQEYAAAHLREMVERGDPRDQAAHFLRRAWMRGIARKTLTHPAYRLLLQERGVSESAISEDQLIQIIDACRSTQRWQERETLMQKRFTELLSEELSSSSDEVSG